MEIRRFGIGHRRSDGPPGTVGVTGAPIHADALGVVAELALGANASMAPHSNPNLAYLVVIEGGGFVRVGDETARVAAGEAVVWPPDVVHSAWTEGTPMRAIVVEFAPRPFGALALAQGPRPAAGEQAPGPTEGMPGGSPAPPPRAEVSRGEGSLAPRRKPGSERRESADREPW